MRKIVQISVIQETWLKHAALIALCDDGSVWIMIHPFRLEKDGGVPAWARFPEVPRV